MALTKEEVGMVKDFSKHISDEIKNLLEEWMRVNQYPIYDSHSFYLYTKDGQYSLATVQVGRGESAVAIPATGADRSYAEIIEFQKKHVVE